jgi:hypothetical protein
MLCTDLDILKQEYNIFGGTTGPYPAQVLAKGNNGQVSGTTFLATGQTFTSKGIAAGHVIYISDGVGNIDGVFEIVSVDSAAQLTISVVRTDSTANPVPVGTGTNLYYRIKTFGPQIKRTEFEISQLLNMKPGCPDGQYGLENLQNQSVLKETAVYWTLSLIYAAMYGVEASGENPTSYWNALNEKRTIYREMAENAIQRCKLSFTST